MNIDQFLHILTVAVAFVSAIIGLYVNSKFATFKADIIKEINGTYVRTPLFTALETVVERLRKWREHDYHSDIQPIPLLTYGHTELTKRVEKLEGRVDTLADEGCKP